MKRQLSLILISMAILPAVNYAASAGMLKCTSTSKDFYIQGYAPNGGSSYQIEVKRGDHAMQYTSTCVGTTCSNMSKEEGIYLNDDLDNRVYTVTFSNITNASTGTLHALPGTIKIKKQPDGLQAQYKAIYYGTDPGSMEQPKAFVNKPINMDCKLSRTDTLKEAETIAAKP